MCTGIEIALIAGAVVSAGTAVYSGEQQRQSAHQAQDQAEADSEAAKGQAMVEAQKIREATKRAQGNAVAALAASGVDVTAGTAEQIQTDVNRRGEEDAITTILTGQNRGRLLAREGQLYGQRADQAQTAGYINAGSSVLSSVSAAARGWRTNGRSYDSISAFGGRTGGTGD